METASSPGTVEAATAAVPGLSITVEKNPPEARLLQLGIKSWPKWGCPPGRFPLKFDARLTCYLLKGRVRASVKGSGKCVEFGAGDPPRASAAPGTSSSASTSTTTSTPPN